MQTVAGLRQWFKDFSQAMGVASEVPTDFPEIAFEKVKGLLAQIHPVIVAFEDAVKVIEAAVDYEENYVPRVQAAEFRLSTIDTSVRAKQEHLAVLEKEQEEAEAKLLDKRRELAVVEDKLAQYRARIAAL